MLLHTALINIAGPYFSQIIIIITGFLICFSCYKLSTKNIQRQQIVKNNTQNKLFYGLLFIVFSFFVYKLMASVILNYPIDAGMSDVIPSLQKYNQRLLNHEDVYALMNYGNYNVVPNYLTMQWIPYIVAEICNIDYRIYGLIFYLISTFIFLSLEIKKSTNHIGNYIKIILPFLLLYLFLKFEPSSFGHATELIICA